MSFGFLSKEKILVTGGNGFLGSRVVARLIDRGVRKEDIVVPRSSQRDLRVWENCVDVVRGIDVVIHLAAKVGGIGFNQKYPGTLLYDNLMMGVQLMEAARRENVRKFVSVATVCSYPKFTQAPFQEDHIWDGYPEETNAPYGLAKKMLLVQGQAYWKQYGFNAITLFPTNLYGPGDNFSPESSHVIPALIKKFIEAKTNGLDVVEVWGTGRATREFLYVDDAAEGIVLATELYNKPDPVNLGSGAEISIIDLVRLVAQLVGYDGNIVWDKSKPDGQPRRLLDTSRARKEFGFKATTSFRDGISKTLEWYLDSQKTKRI